MYQVKKERYQNMKYRRCGTSGILLPELSLGLWHNFGNTGSMEKMEKLCYTAFEQGITHFDLADNYGPDPGMAEENFGRILQRGLRHYRDELVITTKAGYDMWDGPYGSWGSRKHLLAGIDQSLKRMGLEYVDIFYHHRMDPETPLEESMLALDTAVKSGKALYAGISNYDLQEMKKAVSILKELKCPFIVNQRRYSIFDRTVEEDGTKQWAGTNGVGMVAFSPLAQGLLSDKYLNGIPENSRIRKDGRFLCENDLTAERLSQIRALNEVAKSRGETLPQMALAWNLKDSDITSVIIGASAPEQIVENCRIQNRLPFTAEQLQKIEQICGKTNNAEEF